MNNRVTHETIFTRHDFTEAERLQMGSELAQTQSRIETIKEEQTSVAAQFKERLAGAQQAIGSLSRNINCGFEMRSTRCELKWDQPNVGEVTYRGPDGRVEKTRAMTIAERQEELNFDESTSVPAEVPAEQAEASVLESAKNAAEFFDSAANAETAGGQPSAADLDAVAEEQDAADATQVAPDNF